MIERAIIIILDSVGIGELPDAADYGDVGANTLVNLSQAVGGLGLPNLGALGLGNIADIFGVPPAGSPTGCFGKMAERSKGKDTTTGHWEMMGVISEHPFPTYPGGFPDRIINKFSEITGRGVLGNKVASGTEIIMQLGGEHLRTGSLIVYTSADSVFQIAAHEDIVPPAELYRYCELARGMLTAPDNVQRVIARPFVGAPGDFKRTERRRDFALEPHGPTLLDIVVQRGGSVVGIGKTEDIFAHRGISEAVHTGNNPDGIEATIECVESGRGSVVFTNLVDTDMIYGHRNDTLGYAGALEYFDSNLPRITSAMRDSDMLIISADHGCDPTTPGTDHTREYVPLIAYGPKIRKGISLGVRNTFSDVAKTLADAFGIQNDFAGESFYGEIR